jgi:DNA-binding transcriptional ArsR family regulator
MTSMDQTAALESFGALAHATRLKVFKALIVAGPEGLAAGRLAELLGVSPSNLSPHLGALSLAGLVQVSVVGRSRIYAAQIDQVAALVDFLVADCCAGHPEVCGPVLASMGRSC